MEFNKEPNKRVKLAREMAGFKSASEAARKHADININTLISAENGNRPISKKSAQKFANAFNVTPQWILYGETSEELNQGVLPLLSSVSATTFNSNDFESQDADYFNIAQLPIGNHVALKVEGRSMDRIAPEGSIIIIDLGDKNLIDKAFYIFANDNEYTFKRYRTSPKRIEPYSTLDKFEPIFLDKEPLPFGRVIRVILDL